MRLPILLRRFALTLGCLCLPLCATGATAVTPINTPADHAWLLKADRVFDARSEQTHVGWLVLVRDGKIVALGPAAQVVAPADAQTIDLPGMTLLPGLIDAHSHIFLHPYNETLWNDQVLKESQSYRTIEAVQHVRDTLMPALPRCAIWAPKAPVTPTSTYNARSTRA
jgi:hypothetical protein